MKQQILPNILITGTPGTGKSKLCEALTQNIAKKSLSDLHWINIGEFAKENGHLDGWDEIYKCNILNEDSLLDALEPMMTSGGGQVVEHHVTDIFPERWFDVVFVLRTDNTLLYDRLIQRGYTGKKLEDNIQCEIFQTILDEARDSYKEEIVHEIRSDHVEDIANNAKRIVAWIQNWIKNNN